MPSLSRQIAPVLVCAALWLAVAGATRSATAAGPGAGRSGRSQERPATARTVMKVPARGLTLDEAVKLTLQHDPNLKRSQANLQFAEGVAQQFGSAFDYTLRANAESRTATRS